ncbi:uncharacterized protein BYT42DRAFT_625258 [Radiomyces spectabilis]|uniref:uncharacterized protein n=1 Tax=Radiomyces spectabilis TaxID=64574 RepID=UPI0022207216|nr:uncharacterized protein BYT42DRAFT_625258 [Radiomyces spectabilis]KAI8367458.1 hypothetical protein BYT42DRAFT_625258 [Radiomyces spectabilis]
MDPSLMEWVKIMVPDMYLYFAIINTIEGRLRSENTHALPPSVQRRVKSLKYFQSKHAELEAKFQEEVLGLEKKYLDLYRPLYIKRREVITGQYEPTDEEVSIGEKVDAEEEIAHIKADEKKDEDDNTKSIRGIPEFWLTAMKNNPQVAENVTPEDENLLKHLVDIRMSYTDKPGFRIEFEFADNEYFTDKVLTKAYYYQDHVYGGEFIYDHAEGCDIHWKDGKDLTVTMKTKKQRHRGTNKVRTVKQTVPAETFFTFFQPPTLPAEDVELDEEEAERLDAKLEADYEMGEEFKEKIIPRATDYFTGKALEYEDYAEDEEFEDDFYSDEEQEEEDDDDDEEDEADESMQPSKRENAPECKQS